MVDEKIFENASGQTNSISTVGDLGRWMEFVLLKNSALPKNSKRIAMIVSFSDDPVAVATGQDAVVLLTPGADTINNVPHSLAAFLAANAMSDVDSSDHTGNEPEWSALVKQQTKVSKILSWLLRRK